MNGMAWIYSDTIQPGVFALANGGSTEYYYVSSRNDYSRIIITLQ